MYVEITYGNTFLRFERIGNISFDPSVSATGETLKANQVSCDIIEESYTKMSHITLGEALSLYSDNNDLWARYYIQKVEIIDSKTVRVLAESVISLLGDSEMDATMYNAKTVLSILRDEIFYWNEFPYIRWRVADTIGLKTITGYCPAQTRRERLQWICFVIGAYVKDFMSDRVEILQLPDPMAAVSRNELVPDSKVYWRPRITQDEAPSTVRVTAYSYEERAPYDSTEKYVEVGTKGESGYKVFVETTNTTSAIVRTPDTVVAPNDVEIKDVRIVNRTNVSSVLNRLASTYRDERRLSFDVVNNGEYIPGQRVAVNTDSSYMYVGYIESVNFSFGMQSKSTVTMLVTYRAGSSPVNIRYMWNGMQVGKRTFRFPTGYKYEIENEFMDLTFNGHRYVFRPKTKTVTGTATANGTNHTVQMDIALNYYNGDLQVISVDNMTLTDGVVVID